MAAAEDSPPEMYLNFYNDQKSNLVYVSDSISPSPSAQSEGSVELAKEKQHDVEFSSNSEDEDSTQELTNLTWLTQLKNLVEWPNSINPIIDDDKDNRNGSATSPIIKKDTLIDRFQKFVEQARQHREAYNKSVNLYQLDTKNKPPFNYAQMIAMAMLENGRMTLQNIYTWIQNKFGYYRVRNNWNNSIRHNLSLQFCFRKIDRNVYNKGDGKGGYWELGIDANKSERKRVRNRTGTRTSQKLPTVELEQKRRKFQERIPLVKCDNLRNQSVDIIVDDYKDDSDNGCLVNRTLNSINASVNIEQQLHSDDIGIGSIIEVGSQVALVAQQESGMERHDLSQTTNEFHVLSDIAHGDYLNISTLDLMSSGDDIFDSSDFETTACATEGISSLSSCNSTVSTLATTTFDSIGMETQCNNEILLASEVPQPSENVVISELNPYENVSALRIHTANFIIEEHDTNINSMGSIVENDETNLIKSFTFDGIDHEFQLLPNCNQTNRDDMIEVFLNILPNEDF